MATLLLIIIYMAFISLGLPDSLIGVSWPLIRGEYNLGLEYGGFISLVITIGTISSSLLSGHIIARLQTGKVIILSILLTIIALIGYSVSDSFLFLVMFSIPMGFGAGSIDTALNHYVAIHYKPHHMNWLHSFWGVGATAGPIIMSYFLVDENWRRGFLAIALVQFVFMVVLTLSLPLWHDDKSAQKESLAKHKNGHIFQVKGVIFALLIFLFYVALEVSVGVWGSSYLVLNKSLLASDAARIIALYYGGITLGRFISGLASFKFSNKILIYSGIVLVFVGSLGLILASNQTLMMSSFIILGLGLSPVFPSMIHDTPKNFGEENAQYVIGYQIAFAYIGGAIFPPILGLIYANLSISLFPYTILVLAIILLISINSLLLLTKKNTKT
ncbi:MAG: MFS transporter [Candidatus Izemoplasmataceae bacterium]